MAENVLDILRYSQPLSAAGLRAALDLFWPVLGAELLAIGSCYRGSIRFSGLAETVWPRQQGWLLLPVLLWGLVSVGALWRVFRSMTITHCFGPTPDHGAWLTQPIFHSGLVLAGLLSLRVVWLWPLDRSRRASGLTGVYRTTLQVVLTSVFVLQAFLLSLVGPFLSTW